MQGRWGAKMDGKDRWRDRRQDGGERRDGGTVGAKMDGEDRWCRTEVRALLSERGQMGGQTKGRRYEERWRGGVGEDRWRGETTCDSGDGLFHGGTIDGEIDGGTVEQG